MLYASGLVLQELYLNHQVKIIRMGTECAFHVVASLHGNAHSILNIFQRLFCRARIDRKVLIQMNGVFRNRKLRTNGCQLSGPVDAVDSKKQASMPKDQAAC